MTPSEQAAPRGTNGSNKKERKKERKKEKIKIKKRERERETPCNRYGFQDILTHKTQRKRKMLLQPVRERRRRRG